MIYICEIEGRPIAAFNATDIVDAKRAVDEEWLKAELKGLDSGGQPLWNGVSHINARLASPRETEIFQNSLVASLAECDDPVAEDWLCFLVPLSV